MAFRDTFYGKNLGLLLFGLLFTFMSSFGQTFFVSLYVPSLQEEFGLSDGLFSSLYAAATLGSAFTLTWLGRYIDRIRLPVFSSRVMLGFIAALILYSQSYHVVMLVVGLYGVRLFGQGLMTHTSITSMVRIFERNRGKAISLAALGHSAGEAVLPVIFVALIGDIGWRFALLVAAAFVLVMIPISSRLLMKGRGISQKKLYLPTIRTKAELKGSSPLKILRTRALWILAPSNFATASIGTAFLFFQLKLGEDRGWSPEFIGAAFSAYAIGNALSTLLAGWLTDRFTGRKLFPLYLIPFSLGLLALYFGEGNWVYVALVTGIGVSNGFGNTVKNAALGEVYGTRIIGSVRSLFTTIMVFSTALGPVTFGVFLDRGVSFETLGLFSILFFAFITLNSLRVYSLDRVSESG